MQCPNCLVAFHDVEDDWIQEDFGTPEYYVPYGLKGAICPNCKVPIVILLCYDRNIRFQIKSEQTIYPPLVSKTHSISSIPEAVPYNLREDFLEARNVLPISPKASAALSRRVLQTILAENGYTQRNLSRQVDALLNETDPTRMLPSYLRDVIDAIRNFGNFSAHPVTDITSLQVIDVEPNEAEWCIEIVEALFDHYYIRPAKNKERLAGLNAKLKQAGKPEAKS
ncbi:MAG: DUF4145 domain-containing protein [Chloroflexi bacterium]|nr:DUF4145 domain-containing protein [Chloroflexota bacterium]